MEDDPRDEEPEHEQEAEPEQEQRCVPRERDHLEQRRLRLAGDDDPVAPGRHVRDLAVSVPSGPITPSGTGRIAVSSPSSTTARAGVAVIVSSSPTAALPGLSVTASEKEGDRFQTAHEGIPSETTKGEDMGHQTVQEAMTPNPTAVTPDTTAQEAARSLKTEDVGALPIVEEGRLVGVVTDRDLAVRVLAEGRGAETTVREIASKDVVTVDPQQSLEEAARLMAEHQVRRLPVVEEDGRLVGMLAQADVAQAGHDTLTGDVVQKISR